MPRQYPDAQLAGAARLFEEDAIGALSGHTLPRIGMPPFRKAPAQ